MQKSTQISFDDMESFHSIKHSSGANAQGNLPESFLTSEATKKAILGKVN